MDSTISFNLTFPTNHASQYGRQTKRAGWVANDYLGIDQGPILAMLENYRTGFVWNLLRKDPYVGAIIKRGLVLAGFKPVCTAGRLVGGWSRLMLNRRALLLASPCRMSCSLLETACKSSRLGHGC